MDWRSRSEVKLQGVHPELAVKAWRILNAMASLGFPMAAIEGVRSPKRQQALYARGRTEPGRIVTNCDGDTKKSMHQIQADGWGHAVDCVFLDKTDQPTWDDHYPWRAYGACVMALGLTWGGNFTKLFDGPHMELRAT